MTQYAFGQVIPVTGPNIGFPGAVSRFGDTIITARSFVPLTSTNTLNFGDPAVIIPSTTNSGGAFTSVKDYIATIANTANIANYFAGMAVREVKTQLTYQGSSSYGAGTPGVQSVGSYANLQMAEVLERGAGTILLSVGAPAAGAQVYTRAVLNTAVSAGLVGDWETNPVATDLFTLNGITAAAAAATSLTGITFTNVYVGMVVTGPGIAPGSYVVSGTGTAGSFTTIVLSSGLTTAITATSVLTFSNLIALPNVVARTGYVDANNMLEIAIKVRNAA
jgi:hypothetical protein